MTDNDWRARAEAAEGQLAALREAVGAYLDTRTHAALDEDRVAAREALDAALADPPAAAELRSVMSWRTQERADNAARELEAMADAPASEVERAERAVVEAALNLRGEPGDYRPGWLERAVGALRAARERAGR